jgi:hypothetical protein
MIINIVPINTTTLERINASTIERTDVCDTARTDVCDTARTDVCDTAPINEFQQLDNSLSKEERLIAFVRDIEENGVKQGTPEWLKSRMGRIGGSSVSVFMDGYNPFKDKYKFVMESLGIKKFISDIKPQWGNLFEDVFCEYVEHDKKCKILGTDMFYPDEEGIFAYSPDGLAMIESQLCGGNKGAEKEAILLEFKCPYSRDPNGKIPSYYTPQVLMGLDMIKIADRGLYAEAVIRRCSILDLQFNNKRDFTLIPTPKDTAKKSFDAPLALGLIAFYTNDLGDNDNQSKFLADILSIYKEFSLDNDLGILQPEYFYKMMHLFNDKRIRVKYGEVIVQHFGQNVELNTELGNGLKRTYTSFGEINEAIIGVLPYKIFRVDYHVVERKEGYLDNIRDEAKRVLAIVAEANKLKTDGQKSAYVYKQFYKKSSEEEEEEVETV